MISWVSSIKKAESLGHVVYSSRYTMLLTSRDGNYVQIKFIINLTFFFIFFMFKNGIFGFLGLKLGT